MVRVILTMVRIVLPFLWELVKAALRSLAIALVAMWNGIWLTVQRLAEEWTYRAVGAGLPPQQARVLEIFFRIIALLVTLVGWVLLSYLTVWLVNHII